MHFGMIKVYELVTKMVLYSSLTLVDVATLRRDPRTRDELLP